MSHVDAWMMVAKDFFWFCRWPLVCILWFITGSFANEHNTDDGRVAVSGTLAMILTIIVANT